MKRTGIILGFVGLLLLASCNEKKVDTVKVGLLHSLSGTMSISETSVRDAELLAISEINANGGVLGKQIEAVQADGASDPQIFADEARKLLQNEKVVTVFGCWTSASRKAVKPVFEELYGLLWYPVQYEGMEASPNIMYMGASPNQQIVPAVDYCAETIGKRMFLVGSDYVFPRTANKIIKAQLAQLDGECLGEEYIQMGGTDFNAVVKKILEVKPDVILNTLNGDSNVAFFAALAKAGITSAKIPVMSFSIAEEEVAKMNLENLAGHLVSWNYYETTQTPRNEKFVTDYKEKYGDDRMTGDPIEAAYIAVYMWAAACEKAGSFDVEAVRVASKGLSFSAPEGIVTIDGGNQHLYKQVRIGKINNKGLIDEVWATPSVIKPDPYLSTYPWARGL
ncbi:MAG: urea ABC transporter substrate-binding protein [Treponema sp.]|uniref:urea ABC transporter substrate-binding protein n=1 Tax=Treponema sp. TaxID=166 RepID=UPI0025ECA741|nr:urea ABC transporter substrate-binding protein [Treponema sp.]MBQ9282806.1 urea ABC transporter substrate-binding protein [Treponema sp.]